MSRSCPVTILHISDSHDMLNSQMCKSFPCADIVIHTGDFSNHGTAEEFQRFNEICGVLKSEICKTLIVVLGNHDVKTFQDDWCIMRSMLPNVDFCPINESFETHGLKFFGCPWWYRHTWDYRVRPRQDTRTDSPVFDFRSIPSGLDILLTHGPPRSVLDLADFTETFEGTVSGSCELLDAIDHARPSLHLFGHIHEQHGIAQRGSTTFVNSAMKNRWPSDQDFLQHGPHLILASSESSPATEISGEDHAAVTHSDAAGAEKGEAMGGAWRFSAKSLAPLQGVASVSSACPP